MIVEIQYFVDGTGDAIRIKSESNTHLTSICNRWSLFREGGTKYFPSEVRLHIADFSET